MAEEDAAPRVQGERDRAVRAALLAAAVPAEDQRLEAAPVEEEDGLAAGADRGRDGVLEDGGEEAGERRSLADARQVDDAHLGQRPVVDAAGQLDALVLPGAGVLEGLERRRGRAEHADRSLLAGPHHRQVAGVVARAVVLLEGRVVLLVDHHDAQVLHRGEDGAADPHADAGLSPPQPQPLAVPLPVGEAAVEERHLVAEAGAKAPGQLGGERDLGHEDQRSPPGGAGQRDGLEVDLGLARAGDPVEQEGAEGPGRAGDAGEGPGLVAGEGEGILGGGQERAPTGRHRDRLQGGEPGLHQRHEGRPAAREGGAELLHRDAPPGEQVLEDGATGVGPRPQGRERLGGPGGGRRELHAAPGGSRRPLAGVQPRRQGGPHQLARRGQVVVLGPADELEQGRGEGGNSSRTPATSLSSKP